MGFEVFKSILESMRFYRFYKYIKDKYSMICGVSHGFSWVFSDKKF